MPRLGKFMFHDRQFAGLGPIRWKRFVSSVRSSCLKKIDLTLMATAYFILPGSPTCPRCVFSSSNMRFEAFSSQRCWPYLYSSNLNNRLVETLTLSIERVMNRSSACLPPGE